MRTKLAIPVCMLVFAQNSCVLKLLLLRRFTTALLAVHMLVAFKPSRHNRFTEFSFESQDFDLCMSIFQALLHRSLLFLAALSYLAFHFVALVFSLAEGYCGSLNHLRSCSMYQAWGTEKDLLNLTSLGLLW